MCVVLSSSSMGPSIRTVLYIRSFYRCLVSGFFAMGDTLHLDVIVGFYELTTADISRWSLIG